MWVRAAIGTTAFPPNPWLDLGAADYCAVFGGGPGTVSLGAGVRANRLTFRTGGYTLQSGVLTLIGIEPTISTADGVGATLASVIAGTEGMAKTGAGTLTIVGMNTYSGGTTVKEGTLATGASGTLGAGNLVVAKGAVCQLNNPRGALAATAQVTLIGDGKLNIGSGVTERVAGLTVDGKAMAPGDYRAATHPALIAGAGLLTVTGGASQEQKQ